MLNSYNTYYDDLVKENKNAVIDTNLLLLYIVGSHNPILIENRLVSRLKMFILEEFYIIKYIVDQMKTIKVTTSIWTEVCNFTDKRSKNSRFDYYETLEKKIMEFEEKYFSCCDICKKGNLRRFDFTDSTIIELAQKGYLIVTADKDLADFLFSLKLDVINWNKIKDKVFSKYK